MSIFDLRMLIEQNTPWWVLLVIVAVMMAVAAFAIRKQS